MLELLLIYAVFRVIFQAYLEASYPRLRWLPDMQVVQNLTVHMQHKDSLNFFCCIE